MPTPIPSPLTVLQAVELLRNKTPQELEAAEVEALAELVARDPGSYGLLGGRDHVEQYLDAARQAAALPRAARDPSAGDSHPQGRGLLLAILLVLVGVGVALYIGFVRQDGSTVAATASPPITEKPEPEQKPKPPEAKPDEPAPKSQTLKPLQPPAAVVEQPAPPEKKPLTIGDGWLVEPSADTVVIRTNEWLLDDPLHPKPAIGFSFGAKPVVISSTRKIDPTQRWLRLRMAPQEGWDAEGTVEIRVNGGPIAKAPLEPAMFNVPVLANLESYVGQTVRLEVRFEPKTTRSALSLKSFDLVEHQSRVEWTPLVPTQAVALFGATLKVLPDHSILAGGADADNEIYQVTGKLPLEGAAAIRIEAIPDASLPEQGPGRGLGGSFFLSQVSAFLSDTVQAKPNIRARFVRVYGQGRSQIHSLAEVEVFSGGQNVALKKSATQSSTSFDAPAAYAVDGNHSGDFNLKTVTHSQNEPTTWWMVDLGQEFDIERVVVWNRTDCLSDRLANHRVQLLDNNQQVLWEYLNTRAPFPHVVYGPFVTAEKRLYFTDLTLSGKSQTMNPWGIMYCEYAGVGSINGLANNTLTTVLKLPDAPSLGDQKLTLEITQGGQHFKKNLGRFRLSTTTAGPPYEMEPPVFILPAVRK